MEPAVSVRPRSKNHEIQTEIHNESINSLNVCSVVEDEMRRTWMTRTSSRRRSEQ